MPNKAQIFLCYARLDSKNALEIYSRLAAVGLNPWLDRKKLRPGDNWDAKIKEAIRASELFFVLLTKNSVNRSGYLQKEIKEALDIQDEQSSHGRYVIPIR